MPQVSVLIFAPKMPQSVRVRPQVLLFCRRRAFLGKAARGAKPPAARLVSCATPWLLRARRGKEGKKEDSTGGFGGKGGRRGRALRNVAKRPRPTPQAPPTITKEKERGSARPSLGGCAHIQQGKKNRAPAGPRKEPANGLISGATEGEARRRQAGCVCVCVGGGGAQSWREVGGRAPQTCVHMAAQCVPAPNAHRGVSPLPTTTPAPFFLVVCCRRSGPPPRARAQ